MFVTLHKIRETYGLEGEITYTPGNEIWLDSDLIVYVSNEKYPTEEKFYSEVGMVSGALLTIWETKDQIDDIVKQEEAAFMAEALARSSEVLGRNIPVGDENNHEA